MPVTAAALRELHRIHRQIAELRDRLERGPRQVQIRQTSLQSLRDAQQKAHDNVQQARLSVDRKQLDLKSGEQKVVDLRAKLNAASSNKEYQALLEQIAAAEMAGSVLADEILEGLEEIDELVKLAGEADQHVISGERELEKTTRTVADGEAAIRSDLARLEPELSDAEAQLPAEYRADYQRIVRRRSTEALATMEDGICMGCGQRITLNMESELKLSKLVFCRTCGCLLYEPETS